MIAQLATAAALALSVVFGIAAVGKLVGPTHWYDPIAIVCEILLSIGLAVTARNVVVAIGACVFSVALLGSGYVHSELARCQCFGAQLPTTSVRGQRVRAVVVAILALVVLLVALTAPTTTRAIDPVDVALGGITGLFVITGPWLVEWIAVSESA